MDIKIHKSVVFLLLLLQVPYHFSWCDEQLHWLLVHCPRIHAVLVSEQFLGFGRQISDSLVGYIVWCSCLPNSPQVSPLA